MRQLFATAVAGFLLFSYIPVDARSPQNEADLKSHRYYENRDHHTVHSPSQTYSGQRPPDASAQCADGSYSFSEHYRGTCSHHGGVVR
jgi:Protein of unknown function (DUF3761)